MLRLTIIKDNYSEFGSDLVGGVGPDIKLIEMDAAKSALSTIISLLMGTFNPFLITFQFALPIIMSYLGPTKRIYSMEDLQDMFNAIKAEYQAPYLAYKQAKQISSITSGSINVYADKYQNLLPNPTNIDYSKYDINKNIWKLSGYYGWDGLGYNKSKYMMYNGFGIRMIQN